MCELVAKLPRYADTGEPFIPGRDPCWVYTGDGCLPIMAGEPYFEDGEWKHLTDDNLGVTAKFYSTRRTAAEMRGE